MSRALVRDFHTCCLYQKSHALARSIPDASPTRAKILYPRPAHEVISMFFSFACRMTHMNAQKCS